MLTIRAEVLKDKKRMDGTYNVKVRFIKNKRVKRISTNLFATEADLTADLKLKEESVIKQEADSLILHYRMLFTSMHLDSENLDVGEIVNRLLNKEEADKPIDFIAFSKNWIATSANKSKETYSTGLNAFITLSFSLKLSNKFFNSSGVLFFCNSLKLIFSYAK